MQFGVDNNYVASVRLKVCSAYGDEGMRVRNWRGRYRLCNGFESYKTGECAMETWVAAEKWWWRIMRLLGERLAGPFIAMRITANQLTVGRFVFFSPCVLLAYALPGYWWPLAGLGCLLLNSLLDFTDGVIARRTGQTTVVGGWLDGRYDFLMQCVILSGCAIYVFLQGTGLFWACAAVLSLFSQAAVIHHTDMFSGLFNHRPDFFHDVDGMSDIRLWERLVVDIVVTRSSLSVVMLTFRYWVVLFTVAGRREWILVAIAVAQTVRWVVLHVVMARLLSNRDALGTVWQTMWRYVETDYTVPHP